MVLGSSVTAVSIVKEIFLYCTTDAEIVQKNFAFLKILDKLIDCNVLGNEEVKTETVLTLVDYLDIVMLC